MVPDEQPKNVEVKMTQNAAGLIVPEDSVEPDCTHAEVALRFAGGIASQTIQYHCKDCSEKVKVKIMHFVVLTSEKMDQFLQAMEMQAQAQVEAAKRAKLGIVLPGEEKK